MWPWKERRLTSMTPREVMELESWAGVSATLIKWIAGRELGRQWVLKITASDFDGLKQRPLRESQLIRSVRQFCRSGMHWRGSRELMPTNSRVWLAYCWWWRLWLETIHAIGEMYVENRTGARTGPWGTPYLHIRQPHQIWRHQLLSLDTYHKNRPKIQPLMVLSQIYREWFKPGLRNFAALSRQSASQTWWYNVVSCFQSAAKCNWILYHIEVRKMGPVGNELNNSVTVCCKITN